MEATYPMHALHALSRVQGRKCQFLHAPHPDPTGLYPGAAIAGLRGRSNDSIQLRNRGVLHLDG